MINIILILLLLKLEIRLTDYTRVKEYISNVSKYKRVLCNISNSIVIYLVLFCDISSPIL